MTVAFRKVVKWGGTIILNEEELMHLNAKDLLGTGIFKEGLTLLCGTKSPQYSFLVG